MSLSLIQTNLNAGELSPMLDGRVDVGKYGVGLKRCENFIPLVQGPVTGRAGTRYVAEVKTSSKRTWLIPFQFSATDAWILEFGDLYIRFYTSRGQVQSGMSAYEIASPYALADLTDADGTFAIGYVQSADVIYLAHAKYAPRKLSRVTNTNWTLAAVAFEGGPFRDTNTDQAVTVYSSAATGSVTLTASSSIFTADLVGTQFYMESQKDYSYTPWSAAKSFGAGTECISDGNVYYTSAGGTTGSVKPTHTEGTRSDGSVLWQYKHSGYGWATIVTQSGTTATATVVKELPSACVLVGNATHRWGKAAWTSTEGYPNCVTFFRSRLTWARGVRLDMSVAGDYENHSRKDGDTITADMAISIELSSTTINNIEWMAPSSNLILGTSGTEFLVGEVGSGDPFGPDNIKASPQGQFGSRGLPGVRIGDSVLFVQRSGRRVREIKYAFESDSYVSTDMTVLADHITKSGLVSWAFAQEPDSILWAARADGQLISFTFNREQDVISWAPHPMGGDGIVESIATIPSPTGEQDDVWMVVRRTINGATKRYIEYISERYSDEGDVADYLYFDSGSTYDSTPATAISGLGYLEGQTVGIIADGSTHPTRVVTGGAITLQRSASVVQIGLPYTSLLQTMRPEGGVQAGTSQGKNKRLTAVTFRFSNTLGAKAGPTEDRMDIIPFRKGSDPMDSAPPIFTGDKRIPWPNGYDTDGYIMLKQDQGLPVTVVAIIPELTTYG